MLNSIQNSVSVYKDEDGEVSQILDGKTLPTTHFLSKEKYYSKFSTTGL